MGISTWREVGGARERFVEAVVWVTASHAFEGSVGDGGTGVLGSAPATDGFNRLDVTRIASAGFSRPSINNSPKPIVAAPASSRTKMGSARNRFPSRSAVTGISSVTSITLLAPARVRISKNTTYAVAVPNKARPQSAIQTSVLGIGRSPISVARSRPLSAMSPLLLIDAATENVAIVEYDP